MSRRYYSILHKRKQDLERLSNSPKKHRWIQAWACRLYNTTSYYFSVTLNSVTRVLQVNVVLISELCEREKGTIKFWVCCFFTFSTVYLFFFFFLVYLDFWWSSLPVRREAGLYTCSSTTMLHIFLLWCSVLSFLLPCK